LVSKYFDQSIFSRSPSSQPVATLIAVVLTMSQMRLPVSTWERILASSWLNDSSWIVILIRSGERPVEHLALGVRARAAGVADDQLALRARLRREGAQAEDGGESDPASRQVRH
jgi:hypothetical protein